MKQVLFVCTGNSCRSPMAEGLFRHLVGDSLPVNIVSAGVSALPGMPPSPEAVAALAGEQIDIASHRSQPISEELLAESDWIFAMTQAHLQILETLFPQAASKSFLVAEFSEIDGGIGADIPDPIGGGPSAYERTLAALHKALPDLLKFIQQQIQSQ